MKHARLHLISALVCLARVARADLPMLMRELPSNTFSMGARVCSGAPYESDELPVHAVMLGHYLMGEAEVTIAQFCEMLNQRPTWFYVAPATDDGTSNACYAVVRFNGAGSEPVAWLTVQAQVLSNNAGVWQPALASRSNHPIVNVTWFGAVLFCNYLSARDGFIPLYSTSDWSCDWYSAAMTNAGYHLPTESQWEYAAGGAATGEAFPWGHFMDFSQCNATGSTTLALWPATLPVRSFASNAFGLYDMIGNVREWCNDWYDPAYYAASPVLFPKGPAAPVRGATNTVTRGGGWYYAPRYISATARAAWAPATGALDLGLRTSRFASSVPEPGVLAVGALACLGIGTRARPAACRRRRACAR